MTQRSYEIHDRAIDRLREAIRTIPTESWYLVLAHTVMKDATDYRPTNSEGLTSWDFTIRQLEALEREGWLHRPDRVRYLPTDAAKNTWPPAAA
ncbi:hypothetical protein ACWDBD_17130 [Streptomyces sp. NPDC001118]